MVLDGSGDSFSSFNTSNPLKIVLFSAVNKEIYKGYTCPFVSRMES